MSIRQYIYFLNLTYLPLAVNHPEFTQDSLQFWIPIMNSLFRQSLYLVIVCFYVLAGIHGRGEHELPRIHPPPLLHGFYDSLNAYKNNSPVGAGANILKRFTRKDILEFGTGNTTPNGGYVNSNRELDHPTIKQPMTDNSLQADMENCLKEMHPCPQIIGFSLICHLHCAIEAIPPNHALVPLISKMATVLNWAMRGICNPVKAAFELGWKYFVENSEPVNSFVKWQTKMGIEVKQKVSDDFQKMGDMFLQLVMKSAQVPFSRLKNLYSWKHLAPLKGLNPGCFAFELQEYSTKFVDIFSRDPTMFDVLLSGSALVVNAGTYIPGPHQKMHKIIVLANQLLVATSCGILYWAGTRGATCDQIFVAMESNFL